MTNPTNIEQFNQAVAKIFSHLYQSFPTRQQISLAHILKYPKNRLDPNIYCDEFGAVPEDIKFYSETLRWLHESGYIQGSNFCDHGANNAVLSAKGLEVLKAVPDALTSKDPLGTQLSQTIKAGSKTATNQLITMILAEGFKLLHKS